ncbi:hypothetical protein CC86DRAFT_382847 [Ophiobolus disseminans]|uniref:Concanavalin A-like lectin/glucanase n=1 Tax=Ophiobolus disseminans TaxID=1469910 RepID=A0A6A6ZYB6_9PLEO|nr:hypothetical protein CC86DRAFT_382847 [Ophiobolus disseminans]
MRFQIIFTLLWLSNSAISKLLVDFNAERGDDISKIGRVNLQRDLEERPKQNTVDVYIKAGNDWRGVKSAHFHREKDYRRFALGAIPDSLMVWQWKEYEANIKGGANIPLSLEVKHKTISLEYQADSDSGRKAQWTTDVKPNTVYNVGLEILAKSSAGHVKLYWNGEQVLLGEKDKKEKMLTGNMFPGRSDPKIGIYRGEAVETDSFVYQFQIGTEQKDVDGKYFGGDRR